MTHKKLPNKPSALIRLALADLTACDTDDNYAIDMALWHSPVNKVCGVCMAGAVMAKTLGTSPSEVSTPHHLYDTDTRRKLLAIDSFRTGSLRHGVSQMCNEKDRAKLPDTMRYRSIVKFSKDPVEFRYTMEYFADEFEALGL